MRHDGVPSGAVQGMSHIIVFVAARAYHQHGQQKTRMGLFSPPSRDMKKRMVIKEKFEESHEKPLQPQSRREIAKMLESCLWQYVSEAEHCGSIGTYGF